MSSWLPRRKVNSIIEGISSKTITTDLQWNLKDATHRWLNIVAELKGSIDLLRDCDGNHIQGIGIPEIIIIGTESAGKSTNVNRFIGILISDTGAGQKTLIPIKFLISPCVMEPTGNKNEKGEVIFEMQKFQIRFQNQNYDKSIKDCTAFHRNFGIFMNGLTDSQIEQTEFVEVHIRGEGLPYVNIIDFPGARTGADGPEFKRIKKYLGLDDNGEYITKTPDQEQESAHDLIVLVTPLCNKNGGDIVATAISTHLARGIKKSDSPVAWEQHMRHMIEDESRVLIVGTNMDGIGEKIVKRRGMSNEDVEERQFHVDLEQIRTTQERIGLLRVDDAYQTIQDVLPGAPWVLCMAPRDSTFGESVNKEEAAFFQNTVDQYWKDLEECRALIGKKDDDNNIIVTEEIYKRELERYNSYKKQVDERSGLKNFREIMNQQYIECLKRQREKIARRISKVAEDAAVVLQEKWNWADSARNHCGLNHPIFPEQLTQEHKCAILKDILAIVYSEFNKTFKEKFLELEENYNFPNLKYDPTGTKTIEARKKAAENLGKKIIEDSKVLLPYSPLQNLVKAYFNKQLAGVYDAGGGFLSKFVEKTSFFVDLFGENYPQDITTSMINMMLITNVASVGGLTLIKCSTKPEMLEKVWFQAIENPLQEFTDMHDKYIAAHRTLLKVDKVFNYTIPTMPEIQKRSSTDIKDYVLTVPVEFTNDKTVEAWISHNPKHKDKFKQIQMARAFDPKKIDCMNYLCSELNWKFWLDKVPEKVIIAWKRDKQKEDWAEEDKFHGAPTLKKQLSRKVSQFELKRKINE